MAELVIRPHVLSSSGQTEVQSPEGLTIAQMVDVYAPEQRELASVWVEDVFIARRHWHLVTPKAGRRVYIGIVPTGGKKGAKGVLSAIAMIAVAVVAFYAAPLIAPAIGLGSSALAVGAVSMGLSLVGSLIVGALFKPSTPNAGATQGIEDTPAYSISSQSNQATPYGAVQRVYGRHKIFPRVAATPKVFVRGGVAWLQCLYDCGYGPLALEDIRIGDNPIGLYQGIRLNVIPSYVAGMGLSIYANDNYYDNVGMSLNRGECRTFYSHADADGAVLNLSFPGGLYYYDDNGAFFGEQAWFDFYLQEESGGPVYQFGAGNFVNASLVNGSGFYWAEGPGVTFRTEQPGQRRALQASLEIRFPYRGRWSVGICHSPTTIPGHDPSRIVSDANWDGLQSVTYRAPVAPTVPHTLIELEVKATDQLNGTIQNLSCIATSILDDGYGRQVATRNPKHIYWDILTGTANPRRVPASRMDYAAFDAWWAYCERAAQDGLPYSYCDTVIDNVTTVWDLLSNVAACGRATPAMRDGKYSVLIDQQRTVPVQMFTTRNTTSFSVVRPFPDLPQALRCKFIDPQSNWQQRDQMVYMDGYDQNNAYLIEDMTMFGCTRPGQAWRDGRYYLAQGYLRRETVTIGVDVENLICTRGDLIAFAHDVLESGGKPARVLNKWYEPAIGSGVWVFQLDEAILVNPGTQLGMRVRNATYPGGSDIYMCYPNEGDTDVFYFAPYGSTPIYDIGDLVVIGLPQSVTAYYLVKSVMPAGDDSATLELVEQAPGVYGADTGPIPPYYPSTDGRPAGDTSLPPIQGLVHSDIYSHYSSTPVVSVTLSWQKPAQSSLVWYSVDKLAADGSWQNVGTPTDTQLAVLVNYDQRQIPKDTGMPVRYRVIGITKTGRQTVPVEIAWTIMRDSTPPQDVLNLTYVVESYAVRFAWEPVINVDLDGYLLEYISPQSATGRDARPLADTIQEGGLPVFLLASAYRWQMRQAGTWRCGVRAHNVLDYWSAHRTEIDVVLVAPNTPENIVAGVTGPDIVISWDASRGSFAVDHYDLYRDGEYIASAKTTSFSEKLIALGQINYGVVAVDVAANRSDMGIVSYVVLAPNATQPAAQMLGNNVLLRWLDAASTLPIQFYEIRLGETWADSIGKANVGNGRAINFFEQAAGLYTYWVRAIDTAGNAGPALSVTVRLAQPPDYVLRFDWDADFAYAVLVDGYREGQNIWIPVKQETWEAHYVTHGWNAPQDQVAAGFPVYIQPTPDLGTFDQVFDYGAVQPPTTVSATLTWRILYGNVIVVPMLSYKKLESDPWIDLPGVAQAFLTDFQFIKVHYDFQCSGGDDLALVTALNVKLAVQRKTDEGIADVSADPAGTFVPFNTQFIDVMSVVVTPLGDQPRLFAVDFEDLPYPLGFTVYLFDLDGNPIAGQVAWTARGV